MKYMLTALKPLGMTAVLMIIAASARGAMHSTFTPTAPVHAYRVVQSFPHDSEAFTQGLVYHGGVFYESTGIRGRSSIRRVDPATGQVLHKHRLQARYFGEGLTLFRKKLVQLTWQARTGFIYDPETLKPIDTFSYPSEGWGPTHDGRHLIMSNGTEKLYFLDPESFEVQSSIQVHDGIRPVRNLNELEYIDGRIYANVWQTHRIAVIDPVSGQVANWLDLEGLLPEEGLSSRPGVLNGIAYDSEKERLFVTGKLWPTLFEIEAVPEITGPVPGK